MICCPLLMNAAQLLIQDALLKGRQLWAKDGVGHLEARLHSDSELARLVEHDNKSIRLSPFTS